MDKLVTGLIVGGAVGSVVGMALSPKSGKENRKAVKEKAEHALDEVREYIEQDNKKPKKKKGLIGRILSLFGINFD